MIRTLFLLVLLSAGSAFAQSNPTALAQDAAKQLERAHTALNDADGANDRVAALTQTIRGYEDGLSAMRDGLRHVAIRQAAIAKAFDAESRQLSQLLGVLMNIQSVDGPSLLIHPSGPLGTARSGMIVSDITPAFQQKAAELRGRLEEIAVLRGLQESAAGDLEDGLRGVQSARTELSQAISDRSDLPQRFLSDPAQIQRLIDSSETLEGFATGLILIDPNPETPIQTDFFAAKGTLPLPINGTIIRGYNEPDAAGVKRPGLLIATRPLAVVTAPWSATLRYSGPLLDYGNVMILEPGTDMLLVLAGLNEVYGTVGQVLPPDAALGLMGGADPKVDAFLLDAGLGSGSDQTETLYIELRLGGQPVDPTPWFAETKE